MKRYLILLPALLLVLALLLTSCSGGSNAPTWQEKYDLGVRYLSDGNYKEAIIAFTAAIEIDPKQALAYVGRADAYVASGETEENLAAALSDYETALDLDETLVEVYIKLADVYITLGNNEAAQIVLQDGCEKTQDPEIQAKLNELVPPRNEYGAIEFTSRKNYFSYSDLPEGDKVIVNELISALENEDREAFLRIIDSGPPLLFNRVQSYTQNDQYRIYVSFNGVGDSEMQIRSKNGMGYCAKTYYVTSSSSKQRMWKYVSCPCSNWQLNGTYELHMEGYDSSGENILQDRDSGLMTNSVVFDGEIITKQDGTIGYGTPFSGGGFDSNMERIWW